MSEIIQKEDGQNIYDLQKEYQKSTDELARIKKKLDEKDGNTDELEGQFEKFAEKQGEFGEKINRLTEKQKVGEFDNTANVRKEAGERSLFVIHKSTATTGLEKEFQQKSDHLFVLDSFIKKIHGKQASVWNSSHPTVQRMVKEFNLLKRSFCSESVEKADITKELQSELDLEYLAEMRKAFNTGTSGEGSNWIPTDFSNQFLNYLSLNAVVPQLFRQIDMPTPTFTLPQKTAGLTVYLQGESKLDDDAKLKPSQVTTGSVNLTAKKLAVRTLASSEGVEDSIIPLLPMITEEIYLQLALAFENIILNGDTSASPSDSDIVNSWDHRKAAIGLRAWAIDESFTTAATASNYQISDFRGEMKNVGKYGIPRDQVVCITSVDGLNVTATRFTDLTTVDKYGPKAYVHTGEVAKIDGVPFIIAGQYRADLNASGQYDGSTTDNTALSFARRDAYITGLRRGITLKTKEDIETDQLIIVSTARWAGTATYPSGLTNGRPISMLYDVD